MAAPFLDPGMSFVKAWPRWSVHDSCLVLTVIWEEKCLELH